MNIHNSYEWQFGLTCTFLSTYRTDILGLHLDNASWGNYADDSIEMTDLQVINIRIGDFIWWKTNKMFTNYPCSCCIVRYVQQLRIFWVFYPITSWQNTCYTWHYENSIIWYQKREFKVSNSRPILLLLKTWWY